MKVSAEATLSTQGSKKDPDHAGRSLIAVPRDAAERYFCGTRDCGQRSIGTIAVKLVRVVEQHSDADSGPITGNFRLTSSQLSSRPDQKAGAAVHLHNPR
jgi:hypothetical protein